MRLETKNVRPASRNTNSTMERNRNKKAKSLKAAGRKPVKVQDPIHTRMISGSELVPSRNFVHTQRVVRRWAQSGAVSNQAFTLANGHDQFLAVTSLAGNAVCYVDAWRIRRISVWAIAQTNFATHVTISPVGGTSDNMINDPEAIYNVVSRSPSEPASMHIYPAETKPMGSWHFTSNVSFASALFQMNIITFAGGAGNNLSTTLEIEFETRLNLAGLPLGYGATTGTTTLGTIGGRNILSGFTLTGINNLG